VSEAVSDLARPFISEPARVSEAAIELS